MRSYDYSQAAHLINYRTSGYHQTIRRLPVQSIPTTRSFSLLFVFWVSLAVLVWYGGLGGLLLVDTLWGDGFGGLLTSTSYF